MIPDPDAFSRWPFVEEAPGRCFLWHHPKVRVAWSHELRVERYDCRCGKWYWLSGLNGQGRLVRYGNR